MSIIKWFGLVTYTWNDPVVLYLAHDESVDHDPACPRWRLESSCHAERPWQGILKLLGSDSDTQFTDKISVNSKGILLNYLHGDIWWKWNPRPSRSRVVDISSDLCWDVLSSKHLRVVYGTEALRPFNNKPRMWPQACCQFDKAPSLVVVWGHVHMTVQMTYKHAPYYLSCKLNSWRSQLSQTIKKLHEGLQKK